MSPLPGLAIYQPHRLDADTFLAGFVARTDLADFLLDKLRMAPAEGVTDHQLIVGQRGMGKTSLLRRLAIGIARDEALSRRYIPLTFREEQYNVRSLARLWRNCAESLAEWCEAQGKTAVAAELDRAMAKPEWHDPRAAAEAFLATAKSLGGRPVLFIDNLDLILDALPPDEHWGLRHTLQAPGGPILYGAATQLIRQSGDRGGAFYEFFYPHLLHPLSEAELLRCLRKLADTRGPAGQPVRDILAREPERLRTLHTLTGGNPRVLALVYQLLERAESDTVFADLEVLLDQLTPFYKARVEDYRSDLQRAVIDAVALHWDPVTSHDLAKATDVEITTISSQLTRLKNDGLIEEVPTSGARAGYQLVERFFNIWYLMRHGTRRTRQKMYWLTAFLKSFYQPDELTRMKFDAMASRKTRWHLLYREALCAAVDDLNKAELVEADELANKAYGLIKLGQPLEAIAVYDKLLARFGTATESGLRARVAWALVDKGNCLGQLRCGEEAIAVYDNVVARFETATEFALRRFVAWALVLKGSLLRELEHKDAAIIACDKVVVRFGTTTETVLRESVADALATKGAVLFELGRTEEAIEVFDDIVARFGNAAEPNLCQEVADALYNKGVALGALGRSEEEIAIYEEVVVRFGTSLEPSMRDDVAGALLNKGVSLAKLGRSEEAIAVFDDIVARFEAATEPARREKVAKALSNKGVLLDELGRPEEAFTSLRRAINLKPDGAKISIALGSLLADQFGQLQEAESNYRNAVHDMDEELFAKANLAWLYIKLGRIGDAKKLRSQMKASVPAELTLFDAALELAADNFGAATEHLTAALDGDQKSLTTSFFDDLLRLLRLAKARGFGEKLIAWLQETRYAERYAPVHAAFVAYLRGEKFLRDISPEVRGAAEKIYRRLVGHVAAQAGDQKPARKPQPRRPKR